MASNDKELLQELYRMLIAERAPGTASVDVRSANPVAGSAMPPIGAARSYADLGWGDVPEVPVSNLASRRYRDNPEAFEDYRYDRAARSVSRRGAMGGDPTSVSDQFAAAFGMTPEERRDATAANDARGGFAERVTQDVSGGRPAPTAWASRPARVEDAEFLHRAPESAPYPPLQAAAGVVGMGVRGVRNVKRSASQASDLLSSFGPKAQTMASRVAEGLAEIRSRLAPPQPVDQAQGTPQPANAPSAQPMEAAAAPQTVPAQPKQAEAQAPEAPRVDQNGFPLPPRSWQEIVNEAIYVDPSQLDQPGAIMPDGQQLSKGVTSSYQEPTSDAYDLGTLVVEGPELRGGLDGGRAAMLSKLGRSSDPADIAAYNAAVMPMVEQENAQYMHNMQKWADAQKQIADQYEREAQKAKDEASIASYKMQSEAAMKNADANMLVAQNSVFESRAKLMSSMVDRMFGANDPMAGAMQELFTEQGKTRMRLNADRIKELDDQINKLKSMKPHEVSIMNTKDPAAYSNLLAGLERARGDLLAQHNSIMSWAGRTNEATSIAAPTDTGIGDIFSGIEEATK